MSLDRLVSAVRIATRLAGLVRTPSRESGAGPASPIERVSDRMPPLLGSSSETYGRRAAAVWVDSLWVSLLLMCIWQAVAEFGSRFLALLPSLPALLCAFEQSVWQATPGKRVMGLIVTDLTGAPADWRRLAIRNVIKVPCVAMVYLALPGPFFLGGAILGGVYLLVVIVCALGVLLVPEFAPQEWALHDLIAGTRVIRRPGPPPPA